MIGDENMKEAVGESTMTIVTIVIVAAAVSGITIIISILLNNQRDRSKCENAGGFYQNGVCKDYNGDRCTVVNDEYNCG